MTTRPRSFHRVRTCLAIALLASARSSAAQASSAEDGRLIRQVLTRFYEAWNAHDVDKMVSVYAEDVDHINVFGEWHKGKAAIAEDLRLLHGGKKTRPDGSVAPAGQKNHTVEKVRFVRPDVAVVQVRSLSSGCNLGTYVMTKASGEWLVASFTNVGCGLPRSGAGLTPEAEGARRMIPDAGAGSGDTPPNK